MSGKEKHSRRHASHGAAHGGGHTGGAWKVAYADFVTAMMAFFMLMWILAASSPQQKAAIAQYFRSEGPFRNGGSSMTGSFSGGPGFMEMPVHNSIMEETMTLETAAQELGEALDGGAGGEPGEGGEAGEGGEPVEGGAPGAGGAPGEAGLGDMKDQVTITLGDEGLVIEITDDSREELFGVGSADMNPVFEKTLDAIAAKLKGLPNSVRIEGYTDARPYPPGIEYSNWELSSDRANAARRRLEQRGLARGRFESVVGYGDGRLAAPSTPLSPANRRITITVLREIPIKPEPVQQTDGPVTGFRPFGETVQPSHRLPPAEKAEPDTAPHGAVGSDHGER